MIDSLDPAGGLAAALAALRATDWPCYDPARDTVPLRDALAELERVHGVTEAHRFATARIRAAGASLHHPDVHRNGLNETSPSTTSPSYPARSSWTARTASPMRRSRWTPTPEPPRSRTAP
jgi:hypothetical protein